jgi:hypothetical protein
MSVFVNIVRYEDTGKRRRKFVPITEADLKAAVKQIPRYKVVTEEEGSVVEMGSKNLFVELESSGILSSRISERTDIDRLVEAMKKLASKIPGAVVENEDGSAC